MIAILDYGSGNLRSAQRAFETSGQEVVVTSDPHTCIEAAGLVVPGVGAFRACMKGLTQAQGDLIVKTRRQRQRPTFGICIGMQILFEIGTETSREFSGRTKGLGIWGGAVEKLNSPVLPHMGWNSVQVAPESLLFKGVEEESFYFVHSYGVKNTEVGNLTWSEYGDRFVAAVEDDTFVATQFHPEKSGTAGLALIKNWIATL